MVISLTSLKVVAMQRMRGGAARRMPHHPRGKRANAREWLRLTLSQTQHGKLAITQPDHDDASHASATLNADRPAGKPAGQRESSKVDNHNRRRRSSSTRAGPDQRDARYDCPRVIKSAAQITRVGPFQSVDSTA